MNPLLQSIYGSEGGSEALDVLVKYLYVKPKHPSLIILLIDTNSYKGMAASATGKTPTRGSTLTPQSTGAGFSQMGGRPGAGGESSGAAMSVLLSWHEKVVEVTGLGSITRAMTDWRKV